MTARPTLAPRSARGRNNAAVLDLRLHQRRNSRDEDRRRMQLRGTTDALAADIARRAGELARKIAEDLR